MAKTILEKKKQTGGLTLLNFKIYYRATVIKIVYNAGLRIDMQINK